MSASWYGAGMRGRLYALLVRGAAVCPAKTNNQSPAPVRFLGAVRTRQCLHLLDLRCVALRCVALRCVALRCVALRCVALRGASLQEHCVRKPDVGKIYIVPCVSRIPCQLPRLLTHLESLPPTKVGVSSKRRALPSVAVGLAGPSRAY